MMQDMDLTPSRQLVLKKLRDCFPEPATASTALALLDAYSNESWQLEKDRVQLAILKLSCGKLKQLRSMVDLANTDYRDVLAPAEYPEEFRAAPNKPADEADAIRQRDREQYLCWLGSDDR
jgi:hypothetical protein